MSNPDLQTRLDAERSFDRARTRAFLERVIGQLRGQPTDLLPFELVKDKLDLLPSSDRGLREIPMDHIVGSEGRYNEFSRSFLPREKRVRDRWKRIYAAVEGLEGVPPIEVYQVGQVYFVKDGNHRVSVAREMGAKMIQAHVIEYSGPVTIDTDADLDSLTLKAEQARFLQRTHLDELHPETHIELTCTGCYEKLEEHIAVHGYYLGIDRQCDVCWRDAVSSWHDSVYLPLVHIIRQQNMLADFPGRTEADLYLWIMEHRHYLAQELDQDVDLAQAAAHFAEGYSRRLKRLVQRGTHRLADVLTPDQLESAPAAGQWRAEREGAHGVGQLFADILLPVDGSISAWCAVEQAITIAQRESSRFYGLYVARAKADQEKAPAVQAEFMHRCEQRGVPAKFIVQSGQPGAAILERARWVDLIVMSEQGEGAHWPVRVLGSTFRTVARHAARPVLAALDRCSLLTRALLAYDGSPESEEALFVAAHVGQKWDIPLAVVTVEESRRAGAQTLQKALDYLQERGVKAEALLRQGDVAEAILAAGREYGCDWIIMGSNGYSPFSQLFTRSTVDRVLREGPCPVLLCR